MLQEGESRVSKPLCHKGREKGKGPPLYYCCSYCLVPHWDKDFPAWMPLGSLVGNMYFIEGIRDFKNSSELFVSPRKKFEFSCPFFLNHK
jgi:hypothetical protein